MALFDSYEDIENGNNCYQGLGSSGVCYGCPHEADCPYFPSDSGLQTSHLIASIFEDDFSDRFPPAPEYVEEDDEYEDEIELFPRVMDLEARDRDEDENEEDEDVGGFF